MPSIYHEGVGVVATPDGVWHRDSHYSRTFIGGGTQDTDLNKGKIGRLFTKLFKKSETITYASENPTA